MNKVKNPICADSLVLYYHPLNFYSQKIIIILNEKKLQYELREVNVSKGEQYSEWFLELNPKGDIPVLVNGSLIIPESERILNYLEENFISEKTPRLIPPIWAFEYERVIDLHQQIRRLPIGAISLGTLIHPEFCLNPKYPFVGSTRMSLLKNDENIHEILADYSKTHPENAEILMKKIEFQDKRKTIVNDRQEYLKVLEAVDVVLKEVDFELKQREPEDWLCSADFTLADVSLALLLYRLSCLGLEEYFWTGYNLKPLIKQYFDRVMMRETVQNSLPKPKILQFQWLQDIPIQHTYYAAGICAAGAIIMSIALLKNKS